MTPENVLYSFIKLYNIKKFDYALHYTFRSIFPGKKYLEHVYRKIGPLTRFTILHTQRYDSLCIVQYRTTTKKGTDEGYVLLYYKTTSWLIVTKDKDREWLLDFGRRCVLNYASAKKSLIRHVHSTKQPIDTSSTLEFFKEIAESHSIIVFGAGVHHSQEPLHIIFKFIQYLNSRGYRDILMEFPCSFTWAYNTYLETGNVHYYRIVGDEGNFFNQLYQFNASLPSSRKLRVWGMDIDHTLHATFYQIEEYLNHISDTPLKEKIMTVLSPFWIQNNEMNVYIMEWLGKLLWNHRKELIEQTGEREFYRICNTIENSRKSSKVLTCEDSSEEFREEFIKKKFTEIYERLQEKGREKIVVFFGNGHTAKCSFSWQPSFEKLGEFLYTKFGEKMYSVNMLPYNGVYYPSLYRNITEKITVPEGSVEYILKHTTTSSPIFIDITTLGDYTFYDRTGYFVSPLTHDALILFTSSLPSRLPDVVQTDTLSRGQEK